VLTVPIGLDGGGTSSRAALIVPRSERRLETRGGPANVSDFDAATASVKDLLGRLLSDAGLRSNDFGRVVIHMGLAGVMDDATANRFAAQFGFLKVNVTDDQVTNIHGALGMRDGAVAGIGTGSFVGRQRNGSISHVGGWGSAVSDQASGTWLGIQILGETLLAHDGMAPQSPLTKTLLDRFGGATGITAFAIKAKPADFAALAPEIVAEANSGDKVASALMIKGAGYVALALEALGWQEDEPLCLTGGLGLAYHSWLDPRLGRACVPPIGSALDGALIFAQKMAADLAKADAS
jgi:glucosamine kinase